MKHQKVEEADALERLMIDFSNEMKRKVLKLFQDGKRGWDDEESYTDSDIVHEIKEQISKQSTDTVDPVDIAILAAFLWNRRV